MKTKKTENPDEAKVPQILFDLNIHFATSQLIIIIECIETSKSENYLSFSTCIKSLNLRLNQLNESIMSPPGVNCVNFTLSDLQCLFNRKGSVLNERLPFFGPVTIKLELTHYLDANETYAMVNIGPTCFIVNRSLVEYIQQIQKFIESCSRKNVTNPFLHFFT